jgi:hypothetical protein
MLEFRLQAVVGEEISCARRLKPELQPAAEARPRSAQPELTVLNMSSEQRARLPRYANTLASKAWHWLEHSMFVPPALVDERGLRLGLPRVRLWRDASGFCDIEPYSLTVFHPLDKDAALLLRKAEWKRSHDLQYLRAAVDEMTTEERDPTIEVRDVSLDTKECEAMLEKGMALKIPVVWPWADERWSVTEDAGMVGFEVFDLAQPQARVRLSWFVDVPSEWQPVTDWFGELLQWLERCLDGDSC